MKKLLVSLIFSAACSLSAQAQITIDDFSSTPVEEYPGGTWTGNTSVAGGHFMVGGTADNTGTYLASISGSPTPINFAALNLTEVSITAQVDSGNLAPGFTVAFYDSEYNPVFSAAFVMSNFTNSFTTQTVSLSPYSGGSTNTNDITYYGFLGSGTGDLFKVTFDALTVSGAAVPEPSTYAAIVGALALGFVAYRRRAVRVA